MAKQRIILDEGFLSAVLSGDFETASELKPNYSLSMMRMLKTMGGSYKLDPENFKKKYLTHGKSTRKRIMEFVDKYPLLVQTSYIKKPNHTRKRLTKEEKPTQPQLTSLPISKEDKINPKDLIQILSNTVEAIKLLIEKI